MTIWRVNPTKYRVNEHYRKAHAKAMKIYQTCTLWHHFRSPHIFEIKEMNPEQTKETSLQITYHLTWPAI